jgi:crotonobetaine/carnitine-CoA ligase
MADAGPGAWIDAEQHTVLDLLHRRTESAPDAPYLDITGTRLTPAEVSVGASQLAGSLRRLGLEPGGRVATLVENSPEAVLAWWGTVWAGGVAVPVNTAYKGDYLSHQLHDAGADILIVQADLAGRIEAVIADLDAIRHVVVIGSGGHELGAAAEHTWDELMAADPAPPAEVDPADLAAFIYTGGTTGPSKGCMLSHNYHAVLSTQIGHCWQRTAVDVVWTPLPLFHFNAIVTAVLGPLIYGGGGAVSSKFSVSNFWPEMNRTGATITSTLGTMAYLLAHDDDRPEMPRSGASKANSSLRLLAAAPLPTEVDEIIRSRFGVETFSGGFGLTEASLISWLPPGRPNKPNAAGVINDEFFDVRIFDERDREVPFDHDGEIVVRPKRAHAMFEGYWGRPDATVEATRNLWFRTGDIGKVDSDGYLSFVDRKADYLRRRGENISSFEVERILMGHGGLADVVVHAVPSELGEDDLKLTAVLETDATFSEAELFIWSVDQLPYFALPRYVEFRSELPRSPVGSVLKRTLRDEGVTSTTWDVENSEVSYERR